MCLSREWKRLHIKQSCLPITEGPQTVASCCPFESGFLKVRHNEICDDWSFTQKSLWSMWCFLTAFLVFCFGETRSYLVVNRGHKLRILHLQPPKCRYYRHATTADDYLIIINHTPIWILPVKIMTDLVGNAHWYNSGLSIIGVTNYFLTSSKAAPQDETYTWYHFWTKNLCLDRP